jgi:hypothetical protein
MFILLAQNEPKGQPITCPPEADYRHTKLPMIDTQRYSQRTGDIGKSLTLRRAANPLFVALLGCVKWHIKHFSTVGNMRPFKSHFIILPFQGRLLN